MAGRTAGPPSKVEVHKAGPDIRAAGAGDDFVMPRNQPVVHGFNTSTVGEPSWANDGPVILYTGNWHAHLSEDEGITWQYLPPVDSCRPAGGGRRLRGDQVAWATEHEGQRLIFWVIFYYNDGTDNTIRLQVYHGGDELVDQVGHCTYDFKPTDFYSQGATAWIHQPRIASTDRYLYMAGSLFDLPGDTFVESKIWRIELDDLAQTDCDDPIGYKHWINQSNGLSDGQVQFVQGAEGRHVLGLLGLQEPEPDALRMAPARLGRDTDGDGNTPVTPTPLSPNICAPRPGRR